MTVTEYFDRIEAFTESARAEYEISCILNESGEGDAKAKVTFASKLSNAAKNIWKIIKGICRIIINAVMKLARAVKTGIVANENIEYPAVLETRPPMFGELTVKNADRYLRVLSDFTKKAGIKKTISKGSKISPNLVANAKVWATQTYAMWPGGKLDPATKDLELQQKFIDIGKIIRPIVTDASTFISDINKKATTTREGFRKMAQPSDDTPAPKSESAEDIAFLRAQLLIEAADALADSSEDAGDPLPSVDEYDPAEDTISEIEDDVVEGEDYVPEVSGGDDDETYPSDDDLEELEDLLDDDDDAMEIMTERDGTETIDAEPTVESILNFEL